MAPKAALKKLEEVKGDAYYLLKQPHYRGGDLLPAGTTVVVTDEVPSRTWKRVAPTRNAKRLLKPVPALEAEFDPEEEFSDVVPPKDPAAPSAPAADKASAPDKVPEAKGPKKPNDKAI